MSIRLHGERMDHVPRYNAEKAFDLLLKGNARYISTHDNDGDISLERMKETAGNGQYPYAVIVTCSDSRVIPEIIFSAGIGDLFVIRTAGNTIDGCSLGSIEYAISHLGCRLVVVLGHTYCGAVTAAVKGIHEKHISNITDTIREAIGQEKDIDTACIMNVRHSLECIEKDLPDRHDVRYVGAIYDIEEGSVEYFEDLHESD